MYITKIPGQVNEYLYNTWQKKPYMVIGAAMLGGRKYALWNVRRGR